MSEQEFMLTTVDNPFNPFDRFDEWFAFDSLQGYNTCGLLSAYTATSSDLSEQDQALDIQEGIIELLKDNPYGVHRVVGKDGRSIVLEELDYENLNG